jgi:hypothetical protein
MPWCGRESVPTMTGIIMTMGITTTTLSGLDLAIIMAFGSIMNRTSLLIEDGTIITVTDIIIITMGDIEDMEVMAVTGGITTKLYRTLQPR